MAMVVPISVTQSVGSLWNKKEALSHKLHYKSIPTLRLETQTRLPYWSLLMMVTIVGILHRMSSRWNTISHCLGSTYDSGCIHLASRPPLVPCVHCTKSFRNALSLDCVLSGRLPSSAWWMVGGCDNAKPLPRSPECAPNTCKWNKWQINSLNLS